MAMHSEQLVKRWFEKWSTGDFLDLPVTDNFKHTSPFGTIDGKEKYLDLVRQNRDKFLGYTFAIHDGLYGAGKACVRYTARQGNGFSLDVSEWYYIKGDLIEEIVAYYHIGELREERKLKDSDQ
ncbi:MAG: nuclear transport factor 2 family protein [Lewinellaceae bacterium]|nr:nuclear transport factor 2 family protein [Saprospiraceae bacterium]MCB0544790.1 nuclear transport factor 2 family protein [Saprospiraceae bacterium]MCB9307507.1 nuclear transport factor 2 family protein [Lewinellaceae bacterium]